MTFTIYKINILSGAEKIEAKGHYCLIPYNIFFLEYTFYQFRKCYLRLLQPSNQNTDLKNHITQHQERFKEPARTANMFLMDLC